MIPGQLGHYRLLEKLGAGGMGEVYRAHDQQLHREVAIKLLPAITSENQTARARLLNEARAAGALNHPSICTVHEVGEADGQVYIAMELVEGRPLSEYVRERALPLNDVVRYGRQIADALAHAHGRQILHRDLKSANVVLTTDGRAKVLDFGLAKKMVEVRGDVTTQSLPGTLTEPGMLVGTVAYMAPEQLRGQPADVRTDVWALGVVLYEMAAGKRPFSGHSSFELSANILNQSVSIPREVPGALRAVIERCLEKQPDRRYQRATEVSAALEAIEAGAAPTGIRPTRRSAVVIGAAIATLAIVAAGLNLERIRSWRAGSTPRIESMAVLPLENLSGDAAQDYFADGMTEVLSTDLARLTALRRVTARSSVIRYKGANKTPAEIARELNVDALLTGSVHRSGARISITAQLLDPATGVQLWTNRYERELQDVLALRNDIVSAIVREINAQLSPTEQQRLASARTVNPEAFEAYLKGRFHWYKQTREDFDVAERYFQLAIDKDPGYALAYAGIASVWFMRTDAGWQPASQTFPKAKEFMAKAVSLEDDVAELHMQLANQLAVEWDWTGAEREHRRALELNPHLADAHFFYGHLLLVLGRIEESNRMMQRGLELDPLNDFHRSFYGWHLNYLRRYDEAIAIFQQLLPTGPNRASNYLGLWGAHHRQGRYEQALNAAKAYLDAAGQREFTGMLGAGVDQAAYRAAMKRAGDAMAERSRAQHIPAIRVARMYAHAGENASALNWLERAYENREPALMRLGVFWDWLDLHADARFQDLLRRLKLRG